MKIAFIAAIGGGRCDLQAQHEVRTWKRTSGRSSRLRRRLSLDLQRIVEGPCAARALRRSPIADEIPAP